MQTAKLEDQETGAERESDSKRDKKATRTRTAESRVVGIHEANRSSRFAYVSDTYSTPRGMY